MDNSSPNEIADIDHTYAFLKTGAGNRYLKYAERWGGFYIGFGGFSLDLVAKSFDEAREIEPNLQRSSFGPLREIFRMSLPEWRHKVRLALWNRTNSCLELWEATGQLQKFPRELIPNLFDCATDGDLEKCSEWKTECRDIGGHISVDGPTDYGKALDHFAGESGYRFLPAQRLIQPIPSERIYTPIDTLSVLQSLNRRTFAYMTDINPPGIPWPSGIFSEDTQFVGPNGPMVETGYGRFVREYLDGLIDTRTRGRLGNLTAVQRMKLIGATLNPLMIETAAMLFALDIGLVIDSGSGKGRQGIDVVAVLARGVTAHALLEKLDKLGIQLHVEAVECLKDAGTIAFQCKGYHDEGGLMASRLVEFRPIALDARLPRGIPLQQVLSLAATPEKSGLRHLGAWLERMSDVLVPRY